MTDQHDTEVFRQRVVEIVRQFRAQEESIRAQYVRAAETAPPTSIDEPKYLLERATRRFLIDGFLSALGWSPDDPRAVSEEARALAEDGSRLYFDYLGLAPQTHFPVLVVEGKGFDLPVPGSAGDSLADSREVVRLVVSELEAIKRNDSASGVTVQWRKWLLDLKAYVSALSNQPAPTLTRVVLTAGRWFLVFRDPVAAFGPGPVRPDDVFCFAGFEEIVDRHAELFAVLNRSRVVDVLPLALDVGQALHMIRHSTIEECYRAVTVATTTTGASRRPYPTRSVYAAIVVVAANRIFAIVDWDVPVEEPRAAQGAEAYERFHAAVERSGDSLLRRVSTFLGPASLESAPLEAFDGFPRAEARARPFDLTPPMTGSTAERAPGDPRRRRLVVPVSEGMKGGPEYLVVTGRVGFYKAVSPSGAECGFHSAKATRAAGRALQLAVLQPTARSFTEDEQGRHCAHEDLRAFRKSRCHLDVLESHMCCRVCMFHSDCWAFDSHRLPCPATA